jgi:hypothetical protein
MRRLLAFLAAALAAFALAGCGHESSLVARCPGGVKHIAPRVGYEGNESLIVCNNGTVWEGTP